MRKYIKAFIETKVFRATIMIIIIFNSIIIGIQTTNTSLTTSKILRDIDSICLVIYSIEMLLKVYAYKKDYFKNGWNLFDFIIILISLTPTNIPVQVARVLRVFRIFRAFRIISAFNQLRIIIVAIGRSIPGVMWTMGLLAIFYYVFAIIGISLYGVDFPDYFGDLAKTLFTLFQLTTMENWADLARNIMTVYPTAWLYFIPFIIIAAFIIINIMLAIIVNTMEESKELEQKKNQKSSITDLQKELQILQKQIDRVNNMLDTDKLK